MANEIIPPTREEMAELKFSHRVQTYLESIGRFNSESNIENDSVLSLLASVEGLIGTLLAEIYELKKTVNSLQQEGS